MRVGARFALAAVLACASPARAHAPPEATGVFYFDRAGALGSRWVRTNRGLILSASAGVEPRLLCNEAYAASLSEVPPLVATRNGVLLASYEGGLLHVAADGCGVVSLSAPLSDRHVVGLARAGAREDVLALLAPSPSRPGVVLDSDDDGASWRTLSEISAFPTALMVAPSNPERLYVSAQRETNGGSSQHELLVSSDGGSSFVSRPLTLLGSEVRAYVVGVDPLDANRVFVRTLAGQADQAERLLRSGDAGATFGEVHAAVGPLALAIDDSLVWLGARDGLRLSHDRGATFAPVPNSPTWIGCLAARRGGVSVCGYAGNEFGVFGMSADQSSVCAELRFPEVSQLVSCPNEASLLISCQASLDDWRRDLAAEAPPSPAERIPSCASSTPVSATPSRPSGSANPSCSMPASATARPRSHLGCAGLLSLPFALAALLRRARRQGEGRPLDDSKRPRDRTARERDR